MLHDLYTFHTWLFSYKPSYSYRRSVIIYTMIWMYCYVITLLVCYIRFHKYLRFIFTQKRLILFSPKVFICPPKRLFCPPKRLISPPKSCLALKRGCFALRRGWFALQRGCLALRRGWFVQISWIVLWRDLIDLRRGLIVFQTGLSFVESSVVCPNTSSL